MGNYYLETYGSFIKNHEQKVLGEKENRYLNEYSKKWDVAVNRLKESGVDLSKIRITKGEK